MAKTPVPNPGTRYPGLRGNLHDMFKRNPDRTFDITQLRKSFKGISESALSYHLSQMKSGKEIATPKRGFYQWNPEFKSVEQIREEIANRPDATQIIVSEVGFQFGKQNGVGAIDTYWKKLLVRSIEGVLARTESPSPAKDVFTNEDRDMLREVLAFATGERTASMEALKAKEALPA